MSAPVFHHPEVGSWSAGEKVRLEGEEGRHASMVRRLRTGETVDLVDGHGSRASGVVARVDRGSLVVDVMFLEDEPPATPRLVVVQALAKGDRGELAVEMLTEIGADVIVPWSASRSVTVWKGDRIERGMRRWRSTVWEAAKQSRRAWWPTVADLASTEEVAALVRTAALPVVLHESGVVSVASLDVPDWGDVVLVVGPEGGITDDELAVFGVDTVRLGSHVLRTSTAGVAAAAALLARTPRWA